MSSSKLLFDLLHLVPPMSSQGYETAQEILTRIKFIGTINSGEKLDTRNMKIENNTILTPFKRMVFGEGRDTTFQFLHHTIERAFIIMHSLANTDKISDKMCCSNIMKDLDKATIGLRNMQHTYKDDKMFVCNLETLIETIEARMVEAKQKYPQIVQSTSYSNSDSTSLLPFSQSYQSLVATSSFTLNPSDQNQTDKNVEKQVDKYNDKPSEKQNSEKNELNSVNSVKKK